MGLVETVTDVIEKELDRVADEICTEYKAAVKANLKRPNESTGEAANSIHVEKTGKYSRFVGSNNLHLYFFEMGNGSKTIYPVRKKVLKYRNGVYSMHSTPYGGKNIKAIVAAKHGG